MKLIHLAVINDEIGFVKKWLNSKYVNYTSATIKYEGKIRNIF